MRVVGLADDFTPFVPVVVELGLDELDFEDNDEAAIGLDDEDTDGLDDDDDNVGLEFGAGNDDLALVADKVGLAFVADDGLGALLALDDGTDFRIPLSSFCG